MSEGHWFLSRRVLICVRSRSSGKGMSSFTCSREMPVLVEVPVVGSSSKTCAAARPFSFSTRQ
ncbi:hypothetical protein ADK64_02875 [Streptomyces sp. MMG1121]|nr:hypothetical protein ADK64_02875 [Streptomyces sp. MMG1121]